MSRPFRLPAVLSAVVTTALAGALLSAPTTAYAAPSAAPKAAHVKACKKADFSGASRMRLDSSKKAVGKSGRTKATVRVWVYTNQKSQACVVSALNSPKVKKTRKTTDVTYSGSSTVVSDATVRFETGDVFNMPELLGLGDYFSTWNRKAPKKVHAQVIELSVDDVMTAEDLADFPEELRTLKGKRYTMNAVNLGVNVELQGTRTVKVKKVKKAKAIKARDAKYKKIAKQRKADLKKVKADSKTWTAAQPQTTAEERAWVKFWGETIRYFETEMAKGHAKVARYEAKQIAKDAIKGIKTEKAYDIKIEIPLTLPKS